MTVVQSPDLDALSIATIRTLCIDAIQAANSGHPGTPMGMAPVAYTLWQRFLRFDPADPIWPNRDRFVPGVERRLEQGLDPAVGSVASVFMSRRDVAVADRVPDELKDRLALAVGMKTYAAYRALLDSDAPFTVDTIPGETLRAFADHVEVGDPLPADGGDAEETLARFSAAGVDVDALATELQTKGAESFVSSWNDLLAVIEKAGPTGT
jgi:transaldolase